MPSASQQTTDPRPSVEWCLPRASYEEGTMSTTFLLLRARGHHDRAPGPRKTRLGDRPRRQGARQVDRLRERRPCSCARSPPRLDRPKALRRAQEGVPPTGHPRLTGMCSTLQSGKVPPRSSGGPQADRAPHLLEMSRSPVTTPRSTRGIRMGRFDSCISGRKIKEAQA